MTEDPVNVYYARVRSYQTDLNGVMYHAAYFDAFDDARIETFRRLEYTYVDMLDEGWNLVIRRVACEYHSPARMDDLLAITVLVDRLTAATLTFGYECRRDDALLALAHNTYAFLDARGRPTRIPERLRRLIEETPAFAYCR
ncbi:MAG: acyl-CoA thioesterase [Chloroflexota bacterium]